jgi:hypothetical protein
MYTEGLVLNDFTLQSQGHKESLCEISTRDIHLYASVSQTVPRGSQGIREQYPGDTWMHFSNGYFELYLFFKKE